MQLTPCASLPLLTAAWRTTHALAWHNRISPSFATKSVKHEEESRDEDSDDSESEMENESAGKGGCKNMFDLLQDDN